MSTESKRETSNHATSAFKHRELPRVLRRAIGLVRFARETVGASSASFFLVESGTDKLHGLVSEWDWTRTSFASSLDRWPTVGRALESGDIHTISKAQALGAEAEWFGPRGVIRTVCVPLRIEGRRIGVLFFDFDTESAARETDFPFLADVGNRCARAIARRPRGEPERRPRGAPRRKASTRVRPGRDAHIADIVPAARSSRTHEPQR